jgi:hypothetical protein
MMKNVLVGSVAATTIDTAELFCGCSDCSIDWLDSELQAMVGGVNCDQLEALVTGSVPPIKFKNGGSCSDLIS